MREYTELESHANALLSDLVDASERQFGKADASNVEAYAHELLFRLRDQGVVELYYDADTMELRERR